MMSLYFVKRDGLYGLPKGVVERFQLANAARFMAEGFIEAYDDKNLTHRAAAERAGYAPRLAGPAADKTIRK